jgi:hypothetical protein
MVQTRSMIHTNFEPVACLSQELDDLTLEGFMKRTLENTDGEVNKKQKLNLVEQLNTEGFALLPTPILTTEEIQKIKALFLNKKKPLKITNSSTSGRQTGSNRLQILLDDGSEERKELESLLQGVFQVVHKEFGYGKDQIAKGREGISLLLNKANVIEQIPHTDYSYGVDQKAAKAEGKEDVHLQLPAIAIVTLDTDTPFNVWPGQINHFVADEHGNACPQNKKLKYSYDLMTDIKKRIIIEKPGSVFVFRGDLIHSGAYNDFENQRLHISINKNVTGSQFFPRTDIAYDRGTSRGKQESLQRTSVASCPASRLPMVKHYKEPFSNETEITEKNVTVLWTKKITKTWMAKIDSDEYSVTLSQTPSMQIVLDSIQFPADKHLEKIFIHCNEQFGEFEEVDIEHVLPNFMTMFGPKTILACQFKMVLVPKKVQNKNNTSTAKKIEVQLNPQLTELPHSTFDF